MSTLDIGIWTIALSLWGFLLVLWLIPHLVTAAFDAYLWVRYTAPGHVRYKVLVPIRLWRKARAMGLTPEQYWPIIHDYRHPNRKEQP